MSDQTNSRFLTVDDGVQLVAVLGTISVSLLKASQALAEGNAAAAVEANRVASGEIEQLIREMTTLASKYGYESGQ